VEAVIAQAQVARDNRTMKALLPTSARALFLTASLFGVAGPALAGNTDTGFLDVSSEPSGAKILIDDVDLGQATPQHHLPVNAGHHRLTLVTSDGARKLSVGFSVEAGQTKKLTLYLAK
jgi:hypothetical protein